MKLEEVGELPETSHQKPVTTYQKPATSYQKPVTSYQKPVTRNQKPVTRNQLPATRNQLPATREESETNKPAEQTAPRFLPVHNPLNIFIKLTFGWPHKADNFVNVGFINVEIKARCSDPDSIEKILREKGADFRGTDHQVDTYFNVAKGRMKLREGNIENALIFYERNNQAGPKISNVILHKTSSGGTLKPILEKSLGVLTVVDKTRKIFFIDHVKFHIDDVKGLGNFVEIEAIDLKGILGKEQLQKDCEYFMAELGIRQEDLESRSYSDLLIK